VRGVDPPSSACIQLHSSHTFGLTVGFSAPGSTRIRRRRHLFARSHRAADHTADLGGRDRMSGNLWQCSGSFI